MNSSTTHVLTSVRRAIVAMSALAIVGGSLAACTSAEEPAGEVTITCMVCQPSSEDPTIQYNADVVQRFNDKFAGTYHIDVVKMPDQSASPDRRQNYQRLALAGDLPDVFEVSPSDSAVLSESGVLVDWRGALDADPEWRDSFYPDAFGAHIGPDGEQWAIPDQRDTIGIFYNKQIFADAGVEFPKTWGEMLDACAAIKAAGKLCWAMDGNWATSLVLADLIGTQKGGPEFLEGGIQDLGYADVPQLVKGVEYLRDLHTDGYVNSDSLAAVFENASQAFLRGDAAMIANGPWYISDLSGDNAPAGFADHVGYEASPGWKADARGVTVLSGEGAWASATTDPQKFKAVTAFVKFATSREEGVKRIELTNSFVPIKIDFTDDEAAKLPALAVGLTNEAADLPIIFRHVPYAAPAGWVDAWKNLWPSYVKGDLTTRAFLDQLSADAPGVGN